MEKGMALWEAAAPNSAPPQSQESALVLERNGSNDLYQPESSSHLSQSLASVGHFSETNTAYFSWPACRITDDAEERENYFMNLQKEALPETYGRRPTGPQVSNFLELMIIRAFHSGYLRRYSHGTAIGFRIKKGVLTNIPAILVFVPRKVHERWLNPAQWLPAFLEGPGGIWCDVDVVEFAYYGAPATTSNVRRFTQLVDGLCGRAPRIGSGSQVAGQETSGTLGAIVKSRTGNKEVGFLTNRHVAVDLNCPSQKMFHPLPPSLGQGVYLGAVERATSFITDDNWYGVYAGVNPESFVRADGAFIPFAEDFDLANVTTRVNGVGEIGSVHVIDLQSPISSLVGRQVVKVGRSSGLTTGTIMAYSLEYNDDKGICLFTDFLVLGENEQAFDLEGDSGSLILLSSPNGEKPKPVGIIWGGTANRGRLILKSGKQPENWTSGVDLGRLLDLLELDLVISDEELQDAPQQQKNATARADSIVLEFSTQTPRTLGENIAPVALNTSSLKPDFVTESFSEGVSGMEHQFIPFPSCKRRMYQSQQAVRRRPENLSAFRDETDSKLDISLQL